MTGFTEQQRFIIEQPAVNAAVFAAPGSGKTTVINAHILFQLKEEILSPSEIVALTFTKQSALELRARIRSHFHPQHFRQAKIEALRIGTFHAQIFRMMMHMRPNIPVVMSPLEQRKMIEAAVRRENYAGERRDIDDWLDAVSHVKSVWPTRDLNGKLRRIYRRYERLKQDSGKWDFDDILHSFCNQIDEQDDVLEHLPSIGYILVDEYQDTNAIQWAILSRMLRKLNIPLFVVGDDDQCIYGFRGSSPQYLLDFQDYVPGAKRFQLLSNFRSDQNIVQSAGHLIQHNKHRAWKEWNVVSSVPGECQCYLWPDESVEAVQVARLVERLTLRVPQQNVAILARTRRQLYRVLHVLPPALQSHVHLHTFHDSKGKEWDNVIIVGAVDKNPYLREPESSHLEEERRLFYVAMTRARHRLFIHIPLRAHQYRMQPSTFVCEARLL